MFTGSTSGISRKEAPWTTPERSTVEVGPNISCLSKREEFRLLNDYSIHIILVFLIVQTLDLIFKENKV